MKIETKQRGSHAIRRQSLAGYANFINGGKRQICIKHLVIHFTLSKYRAVIDKLDVLIARINLCTTPWSGIGSGQGKNRSGSH
jgi:hypothetical protein